ncbi:energy-coupling factor ABC transporter permease [Halegenticoccus soli]|uniref:energy-coupling factor ABC transporter permease n=1 Tax=Halegenticoccus soli TaxID=1985678 RepID=UPI000C6D9EB2|nr:energy-coupling factor ABC transporter permease [Halegenticoccus soli]
MHTPDGFLHPWMAALFLALAAAWAAFAVRRARGTLTESRLRLFSVVSAGVFAAQLLNWPIPGGTSAHFVGGAFAAIVLGPHLGALSVAVVVVVQALAFGDGGLFALGANVWNMAVVEAYVGYAVYRALADRSEPLAVVAAGWIGVTAAALSAGLQLGLSPAFGYELLTVASVMAGGHLLLGIGEGLGTLAAVRFLSTAGGDDRVDAVEGVRA